MTTKEIVECIKYDAMNQKNKYGNNGLNLKSCIKKYNIGSHNYKEVMALCKKAKIQFKKREKNSKVLSHYNGINIDNYAKLAGQVINTELNELDIRTSTFGQKLVNNLFIKRESDGATYTYFDRNNPRKPAKIHLVSDLPLKSILTVLKNEYDK